MFRPLQLLTVLLVIICVLLRPLPAVACGPFSLGVGFSEAEQKELVTLWQERLDYTWPDFQETFSKPWLTVRQTAVGGSADTQISLYRNREKPNEYESFLNCQKDAFETAANTLKQRLGKFGAGSPVIKDWVQAQDEVFANCSEGTHIPQPAPQGSDALIRADRAYQLAAANFYATNFDEATKSFRSIAEDGSSPWRETALYMVARTLLRKGSIGPAETRTASLTEAESTLQKILADRKHEALHSSAARLMNLTRLRLHPEVRVSELAQILQKKDEANLKQNLWDYIVLF